MNTRIPVVDYYTKTKTYKDKPAMQKGIAAMKKVGWEVLEKETVKRRLGRSKRYKVYYARRK